MKELSIEISRKKVICLFIILAAIGPVMFSKTIKVPEDFLTIKSAVKNSQNGDVVEVEDGYYFERNIIIDKEIQLKAKSPFGAIIYGSRGTGECIFIVRAKIEISGFVMKNSYCGISQRNSPDVLWKGHDLAFFNMMYAAIQINDRQGTVGSAFLEHLIIDNCSIGIYTNDAREVQVLNSFIANCKIAFYGSDHISFGIKRTIVWNCPRVSAQDNILRPNSTNQIRLNTDVLVLDGFNPQRKTSELYRLVRGYFSIPDSLNSRKENRLERIDGIIDNVIARVYFKMNDYLSSQKYFQLAMTTGRVNNLREIRFEALFGLALISEKALRPGLPLIITKKRSRKLMKSSMAFPLGFIRTAFSKIRLKSMNC